MTHYTWYLYLQRNEVVFIIKNLFYDAKRSRVYLWEQKNGVNDYNIVDWVPYVYTQDPEGLTHTIDGIPVSQKQFDSYGDYMDYQKVHKMSIYENEAPKEIQFLAERYHNIPDAEIEVPNLKIYSLDIEVHAQGPLKGDTMIKVRKKKR